jgi:hypothetical protein
MRILRIVGLVTTILMFVAAINATLGYILPRHPGPGGTFLMDLPSTVFGVVPFVLAAILILVAVWGLGAAGGTRAHGSVTLIRIVTGFGLLPMAIGGFWAGVGFAFGNELGSPAATALAIYQLTFLAALLADIVLLIVALRVRA